MLAHKIPVLFSSAAGSGFSLRGNKPVNCGRQIQAVTIGIGRKHMTRQSMFALCTLGLLVLVAAVPVSATCYAINNTITVPGATVFIGEQQLNLNNLTASDPLLKSDDAIGWWASAASPATSAPARSCRLSNLDLGSFYVSPAAFGNWPGNWYGMKNGMWDGGPALFSVQDPRVSLDIWDLSTATTVTGGTVHRGDYLAFRISTNMQSALDPAKRGQSATGAEAGNFDLQVKGPTGITYTELLSGTGSDATSLTSQNANLPLWFWGTKDAKVPSSSNAAANWSTGAVDQTGQNAYPAGVYTVTARSRLNGMYDNYQNGGAAYTGKTVSQPATVNISVPW